MILEWMAPWWAPWAVGFGSYAFGRFACAYALARLTKRSARA